MVILGPNASGKSELGVRLAKKFNGEIIGADSRQIYKGFNLSSGKIAGKWTIYKLSATSHKPVFIYKNIPHHLIDFVDPKKDFSVVQYQKLAIKIIKDILKQGKLPIVVGGTGFYIKAIVDNPQWSSVKADKILRKKLEKLNTEELFNLLKKKDPKRAKAIDPKNKRRLIRAVEIAKQLGKEGSRNLTTRPTKCGAGYFAKPVKFSLPPKVPKIKNHPIFDCLQIGVYKSPGELKARIQKRLEERLAQGMIKEIETLHKKGLSWKRLEMFGLEFKYIALYLQKKPFGSPQGEKLTITRMKSLDKARDDKLMLVKKLNTEIWRYAKRQMTWFRRDPRIKWFIPSKIEGLAPGQIEGLAPSSVEGIKNYEEAKKLVEKFMNHEA